MERQEGEKAQFTAPTKSAPRPGPHGAGWIMSLARTRTPQRGQLQRWPRTVTLGFAGDAADDAVTHPAVLFALGVCWPFVAWDDAWVDEVLPLEQGVDLIEGLERADAQRVVQALLDLPNEGGGEVRCVRVEEMREGRVGACCERVD